MERDQLIDEALESVQTLVSKAVSEYLDERPAEASFTFSLLATLATSLAQDASHKALDVVREAVFSAEAIEHVNGEVEPSRAGWDGEGASYL
jgi:hypothetical protein